MFVFRNYTVENLFAEGTEFSGYDDISLIPADEKSLVWLYQAPIAFDSVKKAESINAMCDKLDFVADSIQSRQTLLICSLLDFNPIKIVDGNDEVEYAINHFNDHARQLAANSDSIQYLNVAEYFTQYPAKDWINWRFYFISQMIVAPVVAAGFSEWLNKRMAQLNGSRKKCLVLDLDNTLWGGVLGEDGLDGIKIGGDYPGNVFLYFQESLVELSKTGVILSVCSKNNEHDVLEAWNKNPFIKLNAKYISAYRINWQNKVDNIRELAKELNIGLDSMVFVDDNPTERELVRQELPMVSVPEFPKKPYGLIELYATLVNCYFRTPKLTAEDSAKTEQYRANARRANASRQFTDLTEFIKSLNINISIEAANRFNIARLAQMTQKTNQFNLTTHRYTEGDIAAMLDKGSLIYCIAVCDKFGDNGITGEIIVTHEGASAEIDTLLLSCRILGKGIENAFFKAIINRLYEEGITEVTARYIPTAKNSQVADFYDRQGMQLIDEANGEKVYTMQIAKPLDIECYYTIKFN